MSERQFVIIGIILFIIGILIGIYDTISGSLAVENGEYASLQQEVKDYRKANLLLNQQILYEQALTTIEREAKERGFINATYIKL